LGSRIRDSNQGIGAAAGIPSGKEGISTEHAGGEGDQTPNTENGGEEGRGGEDGEGGPPISEPATPIQWTAAGLRL